MNDRTRAHAKKPSPITPARPGLLQRRCSCGGSAGPAGECGECSKKEGVELQRHANGAAGASSIPAIVHDVLRSPGQSLDGGTRAFMEGRFGHDFSRVRVHTDARAAESARAVRASAYTVGNDVVFGAGRYQPHQSGGRHLLAHELAHVVQQGGRAAGVQAYSIADENHPQEREAESAARAVMAGGSARVGAGAAGSTLYRHKDDIVAYSGGQSGTLFVLEAGRVIYTAPAVSGHPGHGENEPGEGPIPTGTYGLHPGITRLTVAKAQAGTCGAAGISSGYQEITSTDKSPCEGAHYCNVPCPTPENPVRVCYTPQDCWGPMRMKIEGSKSVVTPEGKKYSRSGFFIHGGNPKDAVSSGCIKSLDNGVFAAIRKLTGVKGAVPLCVGTACSPGVATMAAIGDAARKVFGAATEAADSVLGR